MVAVKSEGDERGIEDMEGIQSTGAPKTNGHKLKKERPSASATPNGSDRKSRTSSVSPEDVKTGGSDSASTPSDQGPPPPKLARNKSSQRNLSRSAPMLFDHLPDATEESCKTFQVINDCLYGSKHMGSSHAEALECDCAEEWRKLSFGIPPCFLHSVSSRLHLTGGFHEQEMAKIMPVAKTPAVSTA